MYMQIRRASTVFDWLSDCLSMNETFAHITDNSGILFRRMSTFLDVHWMFSVMLHTYDCVSTLPKFYLFAIGDVSHLLGFG